MILTAAYLGMGVSAVRPQNQTMLKFDFGPGQVAPGYIQVLPTTRYSAELGYGFEPGSNVTCVDRGGDDALRRDFCTSDKPFFFSIDLPEGNYNVTVTLGDPQGDSTTTIKAELRRLLLERFHTAPGTFATRTFTVNTRTPKIPNDGEVKLKDREKSTEAAAWDGKLTLEFNDTRPCICALEIARAEDATTVYLLGDSTVCDQGLEPWNSWGQMLPRFFKPGIAIANHAESGESLKSSLGAGRLEKVLSAMKAGDYLFLQYGHNDMKEKGEGIGAFTSYKSDLKRFVDGARRHGGIPVIVTSVNRRTFDADGNVINSLGDYPEAARQTAKEEDVALIDLNAMSKTLFEALGPEKSRKAFVQYPAGTFPGQENELKDDTHFNAYGAYELAKCIVAGIKTNKLGIVHYLVDDLAPFDPSHPDPIESWTLPMSPFRTVTAPDGKH